MTVAEWDVTPDLHEWINQQVADAPATEARWSELARKILTAHEYAPFDPRYADGISFGCGTCHTDGDGFSYAGGNCPTILALTEAYGLEPPDDGDVEVIRD
ncbi:hypothetical protein [Streptomyces sp. NPDC049744]|uniref:hypothetical protein n=1 Tax=Streptomyces sp. NPDC049744 TaxID=3154359 RepID=UPI003436FE41